MDAAEEDNKTVYDEFDKEHVNEVDAHPLPETDHHHPEEKDNRCRGDDSTPCPNSNVYICSDQFCDGIPDCPGGADEDDCPDDLPAQPQRGCPITVYSSLNAKKLN